MRTIQTLNHMSLLGKETRNSRQTKIIYISSIFNLCQKTSPVCKTSSMSCDSLHVNLQQSILEGGIPSHLGQNFNNLWNSLSLTWFARCFIFICKGYVTRRWRGIFNNWRIKSHCNCGAFPYRNNIIIQYLQCFQALLKVYNYNNQSGWHHYITSMAYNLCIVYAGYTVLS